MSKDIQSGVRKALSQAIDKFNSQSALARALGEGYTQQQVSHWLKVGKVPANHVLKLEQVSGVSRHDLAPTVFGPPAHG